MKSTEWTADEPKQLRQGDFWYIGEVFELEDGSYHWKVIRLVADVRAGPGKEMDWGSATSQGEAEREVLEARRRVLVHEGKPHEGR